MKTIKSLLAAVLILSSISLPAQKFPFDRYLSSTVTYLGLDYSNARFIDKVAFENPQEVKDSYLMKWNYLVLSEPEKYDFNQFTEGGKAVTDLNIVDNRNSLIDPDVLVQNGFYDLNVDDVMPIANGIDYGGLEGLAVYFIVGTYNKHAVMGTYIFVVYDIDNHEVLFTKKYSAQPGGIGIRNYWAKTYYSVLKEIEIDWRKTWSKGK